MANHVNNIIEITFPDSQSNTINSILKKLVKEDNLHCLYESYENTIEWYNDHIGAKWTRFNDVPYIDDNSFHLCIESAWSEISPFIDHINYLTDNECSIRHKFIDECPTFVGSRLYDNGEMIDEIYLDDIEKLIDEEANRRSVNEGVEDTEDWRWDWMWDFVYESMEHEVDAP